MPIRIPFIDNFPVDVIVLQKREEGLIAVNDKARFMNKEGMQYYELKKAGTKFRPAAFDNMITKRGGKVLAILYEYQRGQLVPIDVKNMEMILDVRNGEVQYDTYNKKCGLCSKLFKEDYTGTVCDRKGCKGEIFETAEQKQPIVRKAVNIHAIEEDMSMWSQSFRREMDMRLYKPSFLEKYGHFIIMGMIFIFGIIMTNMVMQSMTDNTNSLIDGMIKYASSRPPG